MVENISLILGIIASVAATVSLIFSWQAVKTAERNNSIGLFTELHSIYHREETFKAIQTVWEVYQHIQGENTGRVPISHEQALAYVREVDQKSAEWKAIHDMVSFWRYISLLLNQKLIDGDLAFGAFTSGKMLGILFPIERAFAEIYGPGWKYDTSLMKLYDIYQTMQN